MKCKWRRQDIERFTTFDELINRMIDRRTGLQMEEVNRMYNKDNTSVYIFGAGEYGRLLYRFIKKYEISDVLGFIQTSVKDKDAVYEGIPIIELEKFIASVDDNAQAVILLAVNDSDVIEFVKMRCYFEQNIVVLNCREFISQNLLLSNSGNHKCIICGNIVGGFRKFKNNESELFDRFTVIGAGARNNAVCPMCGCIDRNRWLQYVLHYYSGIRKKKECKILHFAPEKSISNYLRVQTSDGQYITADLLSKETDINIDMTNIPFMDRMFDYIIANHVLEHISEEKTAINELKRVLKDDGSLILSFPICMEIDSIEDKNVISPSERLRLYGQEDHVRLYGRDYREKIEQYGLKVTTYSPQDVLSNSEISTLGLIPNDIILVCRKESYDR